jgi:HlyD family secretion protein
MKTELFLKYRRPLLISLAFIILFVFLLFPSEDKSLQPTWTNVQHGPFTVQVSETGEVRAVQQVDVKAPMEWRMVLQIVDLAPEGTVVQKGDLLVQFDISELQKRLDLAEDRLISALAQKQKLLAEQDAQNQQLQGNMLTAEYSRDLTQLQKELMKYEAEVKRQDVDLEHLKALLQLDEAKTSLESQKIIDAAALSKAMLAIAKERMEKEELEGQIASLTLRAPNSGLLVYNEVGWWDNAKKVSKGDKINPGEPIVSIPNLDSMQVNLRVNEMDVSRIKALQQAVVILDAYPDKKFTGRVSHIARLAQKENWNSVIKDFEVIIRLEQSDPLLKPGMTAKAVIAVEQLAEVLYVPVGTVYEIDGQLVVFRKKEYPAATPITVGDRTEEWIVVTRSSLKPGEQVAWHCPAGKAKRVGYAENQKQVHAGELYWQQTFKEMNNQGLRYDYNAGRNESATPAPSQDRLLPSTLQVSGSATPQMKQIGSERAISGIPPGATINSKPFSGADSTSAVTKLIDKNVKRDSATAGTLRILKIKTSPGEAAPVSVLRKSAPDTLLKKQ